MKFVQKIVATFIILSILGVMGSFVTYFAIRHSVPYTEDAKSGEYADSFARMIQAKIKSKSWTHIGAIRWSMFNRDYLWDLQRGLVRIKWPEGRVLFNIKRTREVAYLNKKKLSGKEAKELVQTAYETWKQDVFILDPFHSLFNEDVVRFLVHMDKPNESLFITYTENDPVLDHFQWFVNDEGIPTHAIMWAHDFILEGVEVHFSQWMELTEGLMISTKRNIGPLEVEITNLKTGFSLAEVIGHNDPFKEILPDPFEPPPTSQPNHAFFPDKSLAEYQKENKR